MNSIKNFITNTLPAIHTGLEIIKRQKPFLLIAVLLSICSYSFGQQLTFQKTYGGGGDDQGHSIRQTFDGGYILTGYTESYGVGGGMYNMYLIKTDVNGDTLWTKTFGGNSYSNGYSVEQTADSGYVIVGNTSIFGNGSFDVYLIRTDNNGNMQWSKTYGGTLDDDGNFIQQTSDGGFIITGATTSFGAGNHDVYLIKTNVNGDLLWTKTFGGTGDDYGFCVRQTFDGGYLVAGNHSTGGVFLIKTNANGDTLWTKNFVGSGPPHINVGYSLQQTTDNGFIIAGISYGNGVDAFLLKIDMDGNIQWSKIFNGSSNDYALSVQQTDDDGYVIGGWSQSYPVGSYHSMLIKTDTNGNVIWSKTFLGGGTSRGYEVLQVNGGGYVFLASASGFGAGNYDLYLVKTDANGNSGCNENDTTASEITPGTAIVSPAIFISSGGTATNPATVVKSGGMVNTLCTTVGVNEDEGSLNIPLEYKLEQNFPNPFNPSTQIHFSLPSAEFVTLKVFDVLGNEVATLMNEEKPTGSYEVEFNASKLSSGIYLYKLSTGTFVQTRKMILVK